jgi:hypothetical protein
MAWYFLQLVFANGRLTLLCSHRAALTERMQLPCFVLNDHS